MQRPVKRWCRNLPELNRGQYSRHRCKLMCSLQVDSYLLIRSQKPVIASTLTSKSVLLKNMFNPEEWALRLPKNDSHTNLITERRIRIGTRTLARMSKANANPSMARYCILRWRKILKWGAFPLACIECTNYLFIPRVKSTYNSIVLTQRKWPSMALMDDGLVGDKLLLRSYQTQLCKRIGDGMSCLHGDLWQFHKLLLGSLGDASERQYMWHVLFLFFLQIVIQ